MNCNLDEIIKLRKKIFKEHKYIEYEEIINKMMIPQSFDVNNCIPNIFNSKNYKLINEFKYKEYKILYEAAEKDIVDLDIKGTPIIVVHPFYPILRHANFLATDKKYLNKYLKYEEKMIKLLKTSKHDIVLFESPDSFLRYTYSFLKYNKIKKVILTCHSIGNVLNKKDLKSLKVKKAKIAGCYGEHCIKDVEKQLENIEITRINDLVMERFK